VTTIGSASVNANFIGNSRIWKNNARMAVFLLPREFNKGNGSIEILQDMLKTLNVDMMWS
jgi:hypothetical protein